MHTCVRVSKYVTLIRTCPARTVIGVCVSWESVGESPIWLLSAQPRGICNQAQSKHTPGLTFGGLKVDFLRSVLHSSRKVPQHQKRHVFLDFSDLSRERSLHVLNEKKKIVSFLFCVFWELATRANLGCVTVKSAETVLIVWCCPKNRLQDELLDF